MTDEEPNEPNEPDASNDPDASSSICPRRRIYLTRTGDSPPVVSFAEPMGMLVSGNMNGLDCIGVCIGFKDSARSDDRYVYLVGFSNGQFRYLSGESRR